MAWEQQTITTVTAGSQLHKALLSIGLQPTDSCIVHTRMSAFGFIPGGEQAVVSVLKKVLADGDIIMPAQSTDLSSPEGWGYPPVDPSLISSVHAALPAFDPVSYTGAWPRQDTRILPCAPQYQAQPSSSVFYGRLGQTCRLDMRDSHI